MLTLKDWYVKSFFDRGFYAKGLVFGHHRFEDGTFISTSSVEKVYELEEGKYVFETHSGSLYQLDMADVREDYAEQVKEILSNTEIVKNDANILEKVNKANDVFAEKKKCREELLNNAIAWSEYNIGNNELYLIMEGMKVLKAVFKYEGKGYEIKPRVHVGMFQDSVLVTDWKRGQVDFRYFPNTRLQPYHWSDGLESVHIHNIATYDFIFEGTKEEILCTQGNVTKIEKDKYTGEGLFSPDAVNGKCALFRQEENNDLGINDLFDLGRKRQEEINALFDLMGKIEGEGNE